MGVNPQIVVGAAASPSLNPSTGLTFCRQDELRHISGVAANTHEWDHIPGTLSFLNNAGSQLQCPHQCSDQRIYEMISCSKKEPINCLRGVFPAQHFAYPLTGRGRRHPAFILLGSSSALKQVLQ